MTSPYDKIRGLELLSRGDPEGFKIVYDHYAPRVAQVSYRLLGSREHAKDVMQEVFIKLWLERDRFVNSDDFEAYLFTVVRNSTLKHIKEMAREDIARIKAAALKRLEESSVDEFIRDKELNEVYNQAIEELPSQRKRIFKMLQDQGLSQQDIAAQLNINLITVRNHVYEARAFIRQRVEQHIAVSILLFTALFS